MFIGHGLLAFALAVLFAEWRGWSTRRALTLGIVTGAFAALPDIDVVYAVIAIDGGRFIGDGTVAPDVFWDAANTVHRSMTHSLLVAAIAGPAFGLWAVRRAGGFGRRAFVAHAIGFAALLGFVAVAIVVSGSLGGFVMGAFVVGGIAIATACRRWTDLSPRTIGLAATVGLVSHPWGDLVTGQPPQLFYPFDTGVFSARVVLHSDPTIHLLAAFAIELGVIWLAALAIVRVTDRSLKTFYGRSAILGAAYSVVPLVLMPPTLETSYHFVFSILAVGAVCGGLSWYRSVAASPPTPDPDEEAGQSRFASGAIGLAGTTVALVGYLIVYLVV